MIIQIKKKAQITIPLKVRKAAGIEEGDLLDITVKDKGIILKPVTYRKVAIKPLDPTLLRKIDGMLSVGGDALKDSRKIDE